MAGTWDEEKTRALGPNRGQITAPTIRMGGESPVGPVQTSVAETVILGGAPPSFAWLVIRNGPRAGRLCTMNPKGTTIGRDSQCDVILDDESVSRQHAKVKARKGKKDQYSIWDLASGNGTFVNDKQVVKQALKDGDEIRIGQITLVFKQV